MILLLLFYIAQFFQNRLRQLTKSKIKHRAKYIYKIRVKKYIYIYYKHSLFQNADSVGGKQYGTLLRALSLKAINSSKSGRIVFTCWCKNNKEGANPASPGRALQSLGAITEKGFSCIPTKHAYEYGRTERRVSPESLRAQAG